MKEEKKKKKSYYIENIKKLCKSKRGKAILFFVFYFIFFFVLISLIRSNYNSNSSKIMNNDNNIETEYKLNGIANGNYHFIREEVINGMTTVFTGDKENNKVEGIMTTNNTFSNYFIYDNINLIKITDKYEVTSELYHFNTITADNKIEEILRKSTLLSKTEYETGTTSYNYQITTNTLDQIINNTNIDIADIPNNITLETNEEEEVVKIIYDLSSYATYINQTPITTTTTITYSNFGEIGELKIPESS